MNYTPLDRIELLDAGRSARGIKLTTRSDIGCHHAITRGVVTGYPWSLAMEAAFQCAQAVLAPVMPETHHAILVRVDRARFERPLPFGARLAYGLRVLRRNPEIARVACDVEADGETAGELVFTMGIVAAGSPLVSHGFRVYRDYLVDGWRNLRALRVGARDAA